MAMKKEIIRDHVFAACEAWRSRTPGKWPDPRDSAADFARYLIAEGLTDCPHPSASRFVRFALQDWHESITDEQPSIIGEVERRYSHDEENDLYSFWPPGSRRPFAISGDDIRAMKRQYSNPPMGEGLTVNQLCQAWGLSRDLFVFIKRELGWTHDQDEDDESKKSDEPAVRLPTHSREYYVEPISALFLRESQAEIDFSAFEIRDPEIRIVPDGSDEPLVGFSKDGRGFAVNSNHPYYQGLEARLNPDTKAGRLALREIRALITTDKLLEGFLYETGLNERIVERVVRWRDNLLREVAGVKPNDFAEIRAELYAASRAGNEVFEAAITKVFRRMGFEARRDGRSGAKDGIVIFPRMSTEKPWKLSIEAKGKKDGALPNDDAEVSGAAAHRDEAGADHAVVIAREFAGLTKGDDAQILKECRADGKVAIVELDALIELLKALDQYAYSLDNRAVYDALTEIETPEAKLERIRGLSVPFETFNFRWLLDKIWEKQNERDGRPVSHLDIFYLAQDELDGFSLGEEEFVAKIEALQALAPNMLQFESDRVLLTRAPDLVADHVHVRLARD